MAKNFQEKVLTPAPKNRKIVFNRAKRGGSLARGFTITEVLVSLAIFTIVFIGVVGAVLALYKAYYYTFQQAQAVTEARQGIKIMLREIREARPGDDGAYTIEAAEDFQFIFYSDIDQDGAVERVRYWIDGTDFKKEIINSFGSPPIYITDPTAPNYSAKITILSRYVRNAPPIFRYFDGNLAELPAPARLQDTKLMRLYLVINIDPNKPPLDFALESDVQLRNLKTNL